MARIARQPNHSVGACATAAIIAFPFLLVAATFLVRAIFIPMVDLGVPFDFLPEAVVLGILTSAAVVLAYLPSRWIYTSLRWKEADETGKYCITCGYDLRGNESGVCSECGTKIEPDAGARS